MTERAKLVDDKSVLFQSAHGVRISNGDNRELGEGRDDLFLREPSLRVRVDIIGHARIKFVCKSQPCMVLNGRLIPHAS